MDSQSFLVDEWSISEVTSWLRSQGFGDLTRLFAKHQIDGQVLLTLTEKDMANSPINMETFGQIRKMRLAIDKLCQQNIVSRQQKASQPRGIRAYFWTV